MEHDSKYCDEGHLQEPPRYKQLESVMLQHHPHNCIGMIRLRDSKGRTSIATGTLISKNLVLTSAHILFNNGKIQITEMIPFEFCLNLHKDRESPATIRVPIADYKYAEEYLIPLKKMFKYKA